MNGANGHQATCRNCGLSPGACACRIVNGRYHGTAETDAGWTEPFPLDEPPTRPGTPLAKLTPPAGTILDGPLTRSALRAELASFKAEMVEAMKVALSDARNVADAQLYRDVKALERRVFRLEPNYADGPG